MGSASINSRGLGASFLISPFLYFAIFLCLIALSGGASRADAQSQLIVRLVAIFFGCIGLLIVDRASMRAYQSILLFLGSLALLMLAQLVLLPPAVWTAFPGHDLMAQAATLAGLEQPWRPISLTPDLTINSVMSLLPAFAAIFLFAAMPPRSWFWVLLTILILILISGRIGLAQISGGADFLYLYRITNFDTAVGLFANRNHQALFLALAFPLMAAMIVYPRSAISENGTAQAMLAGLTLLFLPLIFVTGSRAGLVLALVGIAAGALIYSSGVKSARERRKGLSLKKSTWIWIAGLLAAVLLIAVTINLSKAEAVQRLFSQDIAQERRYLLFWPFVGMITTYFPFGSGFGSFPDVFRIHEPFNSLSLSYMNHAHNDVLELLIEGGAAAGLLLLAFVSWLALRSYRLWTASIGERRVLMGRLGSVNILMISLASLADYPVRTPTMGVIFVLSCCWLALPGKSDAGQPLD